MRILGSPPPATTTASTTTPDDASRRRANGPGGATVQPLGAPRLDKGQRPRASAPVSFLNSAAKVLLRECLAAAATGGLAGNYASPQGQQALLKGTARALSGTNRLLAELRASTMGRMIR